MTTLDRQLLDCMCTLAQASVAGHPWQPVLEDKTTSEWLEDPLLGGNDVHPLIIDEPTGQTQGPGLGPGLGLGLGPGQGSRPGSGPGLGQGVGLGKEIDDLLLGLTERLDGSLSQALVKAMKASRKVPDDQVATDGSPSHTSNLSI